MKWIERLWISTVICSVGYADCKKPQNLNTNHFFFTENVQLQFKGEKLTLKRAINDFNKVPTLGFLFACKSIQCHFLDYEDDGLWSFLDKNARKGSYYCKHYQVGKKEWSVCLTGENAIVDQVTLKKSIQKFQPSPILPTPTFKYNDTVVMLIGSAQIQLLSGKEPKTALNSLKALGLNIEDTDKSSYLITDTDRCFINDTEMIRAVSEIGAYEFTELPFFDF